MSITVCLLAYKEEENLKILLPQIIKQISSLDNDYEILVIDSEKPLDNTKKLCSQYKNVKYYNQESPRFGGALKTGIKYASKDLFLIMDSDGSHDPIYIPQLIYKMKETNCNVVIGSRYIKGGVNNDSKVNLAMSKVLNFAFRIALGLDAKDISTDYRLYKTRELKRIKLNYLDYNILQEILIKLKTTNKDFEISEIPINFKKRKYGSSKRKLIPFIIGYIKSLLCLYFYRINNEKRYSYNLINIITGFAIFTILYLSLGNYNIMPIFFVSLISSLISYLFCVFSKIYIIKDVVSSCKKYYIIGNLITGLLISITNSILSYTFSSFLSIGLTYFLVTIISIPILLICAHDFKFNKIKQANDKYSMIFKNFHFSRNFIIFLSFTIIFSVLILGACLYISIDSDYANLTLEANDIIHGNPFLKGWTQTGISFICSDLFAFEIFTLFFGVSKLVTPFATWLMIMLVYFATFGLIYTTTKISNRTNLIILFILLMFLPNFTNIGLLRAHTMVTFYSLIIILCLFKILNNGKIDRRIICIAVLITFSTMSDSTFIPFYLFPILLFLLLNVVYKKSYKVNIKLNISLILVISFSFIIGYVFKICFYKIGNANPGSFPIDFCSPSNWFLNLKNVLIGFYSSSGGTTNIINGWYTINNLLIILYLSLTLVFAIYNIFCFLFKKTNSIINFCISLSPIVMLVVLSVTKLYVDQGSIRYYQSYIFINCIIIFNFVNLTCKIKTSKIKYSFTSIFFIVFSIFNSKDYKDIYRNKRTFQDTIAETIINNDLKNGFSSFWIASHTTVISNNKVSLRTMINYDDSSFCLFDHFSNLNWYNNYFNYVITDDIYKPQGLNIDKTKAITVFGIPSKEIKINLNNASNVYLLIYNYDISQRVIGCPHYKSTYTTKLNSI